MEKELASESCTHRSINLYDDGHWHCNMCHSKGTDLALARVSPTVSVKEISNVILILKILRLA